MTQWRSNVKDLYKVKGNILVMSKMRLWRCNKVT